MENYINKSRHLERFYNKVRLNLQESESESNAPSESEAGIAIPERLEKHIEYKDVPEEQLYGKIKKEELDEILKSYSNQQAINSKAKLAVKCDKVAGNSFEKLLHSKHGFHHSGSTDYLVEKLKMKDIGRYSYLGGLSRYNLFQGEDLDALTKYHNRIYIKEFVKKAWTFLDGGQPHLARQQLEAAFQLDSKNGDALACRARYHEKTKNFTQAIEDYQESIKNNPEDKFKVFMYLSDCLYQRGLVFYHSKDYAKALNFFETALKYYPENHGAILHKNLCQSKIKENTPFTREKPPTYRK